MTNNRISISHFLHFVIKHQKFFECINKKTKVINSQFLSSTAFLKSLISTEKVLASSFPKLHLKKF